MNKSHQHCMCHARASECIGKISDRQKWTRLIGLPPEMRNWSVSRCSNRLHLGSVAFGVSSVDISASSLPPPLTGSANWRSGCRSLPRLKVDCRCLFDAVCQRSANDSCRVDDTKPSHRLAQRSAEISLREDEDRIVSTSSGGRSRVKLFGILTDRDLRQHLNQLLRTKVDAVMTAVLFSAAPCTSVEQADHLLVTNKIGSLPVVEDAGWFES